jgi:hypothetical protein
LLSYILLPWVRRLQALHQGELQLSALESASELAGLQAQAALIAQELDQQHLLAALSERHHMMEQEQVRGLLPVLS